jgi:Tfp pilus assembly PilM family ATPase
VQIARTPTGLCVERVFGMQTRRSTDRAADILRSLVREHGFDRRARIAVSLPHNAIFFSEIETDEAGLETLEQGFTAELHNDLPIAADEAIGQICSTRQLSNGRQTVLLAATSGTLLKQELELLSQGKMQPAAVDTSVTALQTAIAHNHPESTEGNAALLSVDGGMLTLVITNAGRILTVRTIPVRGGDDPETTARALAEVVALEAEITWRKLFGTDLNDALHLFLVCAPHAENQLTAAIEERTPCRITPVRPFAAFRACEGTTADFPVLVAEGLALRGFEANRPGRVDFLAALNARRERPRSAKQELTLCAALVIATALIWSAGLFVRLSRLEAQYAQVQQQIAETFRQALPEERNIVNPLAQFQQKLTAAREGDGLLGAFGPDRVRPLQVLHALSTQRPPDGNLQLDDLLVTGNSIRVVGSCDTFATLLSWRRLLARTSGFEVADAQSPEKDAQSGKVRFVLSLAPGRRKP